jgi:hypothetical protein
MAINEFKRMQQVLNTCPLCEQDDKPPVAPVVATGTRVFLTLPTEPELSAGGAVIVPIQHRVNMMECDDDEWEEVRVWHYFSVIYSLSWRSTAANLVKSCRTS